MYADQVNSIGRVAPYPSNANYPQTDAPSAPDGLASALKQLAEQVENTSIASENINSSLGIGPPKDVSPAQGQAGGPVGLVLYLTQQLRSSNGRLGSALQHLNS